jgi:hypothetical protein
MNGTCWSGALGHGLYPPMVFSRIYLQKMTGDLCVSTATSTYVFHFERGNLVDCTSGRPARGTPLRQGVSDVFNWGEGWFSCAMQQSGQVNETADNRATAELILDGVREMQNLTLVEEALGGSEGLVQPVETHPDNTDFQVSPEEGFLFSRLEGPCTVEDLCLVSPVTRPETLRGIYVLLCAGMVGTADALQQEDAATSSPGEDGLGPTKQTVREQPTVDRVPEQITHSSVKQSTPKKVSLGVPKNRNWRDDAAAVYGEPVPAMPGSGLLNDCDSEKTPSDMARYHFEKGLEHFSNEDFHSAIQLFQQAVKLDDQQAEYHRHLALALSRNPMWGRRAEEALLRAVELEPDHAETHYFLGRIYLDSGLPRRALERFKESLRLNPDLEPARLELSVMDGANPVEERELVSASLFDRD